MDSKKDIIEYSCKRIWAYWIFVAVCFIAGIAGRVYGAWAGRYISNPDCGIVALMARHIAEGGAWPTFFYGQAYMGSLEPMISALLCRLFGISGFMVCMGTAVAAIFTLPIIYLWGRDIGGKSGALTAIALCAIGPYFYFMFQFAPRGGYMVMLFLGLLCMWLSAKTAFELCNGIIVKWYRYFIIGLAAGLGWWTNPLIISALLASAVMLAIGLRKKIFSVFPLYGLIGFMLGSAPFWLWNMEHHWQSFDMLAATGSSSLLEGFSYLVQRYDRLMGMNGWHGWLRAVFMWVYLVLAGLGLLFGIKNIRYNRLSLRGAGTLAAGLFLLFSVLFFVRSSFASMNTARYLVPLIPPIAVLIGSLVTFIRRKFGIYAAAIPVLFLLVSYWPAFKDLHGQSLAAPVRAERADKLKEYLIDNNIKELYGSFMFHSLNFNMNEDVVVTTLRGDRYEPYRRQGELNNDIGFLYGYSYISDFLRNTGGSSLTGKTSGYSFIYNCTPPKGGLMEVSLKGKCEIIDNIGRDCSGELLDRNINTVWRGNKEKEEWILITLDIPQVLRRIRLFGNGAEHFPRQIRIEVLEDGKTDWTVIHDNHSVTGYFWSGPRPYWWGRRHRQEYSLNDLKISAIKIVSVPTGRKALLWQLKELQIFAPSEDSDFDPVKSINKVIEKLQELGISRLFADRWESNQVFDLLEGKVRVELNPSLFYDYSWNVGTNMTGIGSAILVRSYDALLTRRKLLEAGISVNEEVIDGWILFFDFRLEHKIATRPLVWTGFTLLSSEVREFDVTTPVKFSDNIILDGFSIQPKIVKPGDFFRVSFCWRKLSDSIIANNLAVFVHFIDDNNMFQDDYKLCGFMPEIYADNCTDKDVCYVSRIVQVPKNAKVGERIIKLGLYDTLYGGRGKIETSLETHKRAVIIPETITVIK